MRWVVKVQARGAEVRWWRWALGRVLQAVCSGALEMGWCDAAWPGSQLGQRTLLAGALAAPLARFDPFGPAGVRGEWSSLSPWG